MIVSAALCPCPPLLLPELTGQADVLPELRAACAAAVASLTAAAPDLTVVIGPDEETAAWPAGGRLDLAAYAPARGTGRDATGRADTGPAETRLVSPALPLSLGIGARLLDDAGYAGPRALQAVAALAPPPQCLQLGRRLAASASRVALLVMGDGSARRSPSAPGHLDDRAAPFDAAVEEAVRAGDLAALAALDPALATELLAVGRPAWQVLAGALAADGAPAGRPAEGLAGEILYSADPFGVQYLVARLSPGARGHH